MKSKDFTGCGLSPTYHEATIASLRVADGLAG